MQGTAGTTAGSHGEVLLAREDTLFLVRAGYRVLEARRVGGIAGDGDIDILMPKDSDTLTDVVSTIAAYATTDTVGVTLLRR